MCGPDTNFFVKQKFDLKVKVIVKELLMVLSKILKKGSSCFKKWGGSKECLLVLILLDV